MSRSWSEMYVDRQVDDAWKALRADLGDRFADALSSGTIEPIEIEGGEQRMLIELDDEHIIIDCGGEVTTSGNADEAAYLVFQILHDEWQVLHPVFLQSPIIDVPAIADEPFEASVVVPTLAKAASQEELQAWVVATFEEGRTEKLRVASNGDIFWQSRRGARVRVRVRGKFWIEISAVIARDVSFKKARKEIETLARRRSGVSFTLRQDTIVATRLLDASPFAAAHLKDALRLHLNLCDDFADVQEKVLRKRVKRERADLAAKEAQVEELKAQLAHAQEELETRTRWAQRSRLRMRGAIAERDEALKMLEEIKGVLAPQIAFQTCQGMGDVMKSEGVA